MHRHDLVTRYELCGPSPLRLLDADTIHTSDEWKLEEQLRSKKFRELTHMPARVDTSLKQQMRFGIPCSHRRSLWLLASGGMDLLLDRGDSWAAARECALEADLSPADFFGLVPAAFGFFPESTQIELREFLHVIWVHNRGVRFSPLIPIVSGLLFLFMEPPLAYASLQAMINRSRVDRWYFPLTEEGFIASANGMKHLVEAKSADVVAHARHLGLSLGQLVLTIFPTFFLPFTTLPVSLTVFDSYVAEGRKVLTRLCIALMLECRAKLLKTQSAHDFLAVLITAIERTKSVDAMKVFLKRGFKLTLSRSRHICPAEAAPRRLSVPRVALEEALSVQLARSLPLNADLACEIQHELVPHVIGGKVLTADLFLTLREFMPRPLQRYSAVNVFMTSEKGVALSSLFESCVRRHAHILVMRTERDIIGALLSDPPLPSAGGRPFGAATMFVFRGGEVFRANPPGNDRFMTVAADSITVGGPKPAIFLPDGMERVESHECETFGSPALVEGAAGDRVIEVELYALHLGVDVQRKCASLN